MSHYHDGIHLGLDELIKLRFHAKSLTLPCLQKSQGARNGSHLSTQLGRGMELEEVRHYQPGDDRRLLDWKVTARSGTLHTRRFREERDRQVTVFTDFSPSMYFGTRMALKSVVAAHLCMLIAWAAHTTRDPVNGIVYTGHELHYLPERIRQPQLALLNILTKTHEQQLLKTKDKLTLSFNIACQQLLQRLRSHSLCVVISDFTQYDAETAALLTKIAQKQQLMLLHLSDPLERALPRGGLFAFSDMQEASQLLFDASHLVQRAEYAHAYEKRQQALQTLCQAQAIHYVACATTDDPPQLLKEAMRRWIRHSLN